MQTVIKHNFVNNTEQVINIFYGENDIYVNNWVKKYFENEINQLKSEDDKSKCDLDFFVEIRNNVFYLIQKYKLISKGYLYNTSEKVTENLQSIRLLDFDGYGYNDNDNDNDNVKTLSENLPVNELWNDINSDIVHRVMKQMDRDSLYQCIIQFDKAIKTKKVWTSTELIMLHNEITKDFKKLLYSSIIKKNSLKASLFTSNRQVQLNHLKRM